MSASRIQKLEALLERVQDRRNAPRPSSGGAAAAPSPKKPAPQASPLEAAMQDLGVVAPPAKPASSRPPKPTPAARPSVKPESTPPVQAKPQPKPRPAPPKPQPVRPVRPKPVVPKPQAAKPAQPISLDPEPPAASGPVASVASKPETTTPATFGELLDRTLALRPR